MDVVRMGKALRILRIARMLRLVRVVKLFSLLDEVSDYSFPDYMLDILGIFKFIFAIVGCNHFIAHKMSSGLFFPSML